MMLSEKARYLIAGICNSIFGYCIGLVLYETFFLKFHIILILVIANILAISFAFLTYKIYVFKTKGNWLAEYLKCYVVYSGTNVAGILLIWTLVDFFVIQFWISQGLAMTITIIASYFTHRRFTFKKISK